MMRTTVVLAVLVVAVGLSCVSAQDGADPEAINGILCVKWSRVEAQAEQEQLLDGNTPTPKAVTTHCFDAPVHNGHHVVDAYVAANEAEAMAIEDARVMSVYGRVELDVDVGMDEGIVNIGGSPLKSFSMTVDVTGERQHNTREYHNRTLQFDVLGQQAVAFIPAFTADAAVAELVCSGISELNSTDLEFCIPFVTQQSRFLRLPMVTIRMFVRSTGSVVFVPRGSLSTEVATRVCAKENTGFMFEECRMDVVTAIRKARDGSSYRSTPPSTFVVPGEERYWSSVKSLEENILLLGAVIIEGHTALHPPFSRFLLKVLHDNPNYKTVCEIGFNAGHSALIALSARSDTRVLAFDIMKYDHSRMALRVLRSSFNTQSERILLVEGDSKISVPAFAQSDMFEPYRHQCDIVVIDGDHGFDAVIDDTKAMRPYAAPDHILVMDDVVVTPRAQWCIEGERAWRELINSGVAEEGSPITGTNAAHGRYK